MSVHEIDNLIVHMIRFLTARPYRPRRAVLEMVSHQLAADPAKRFLDRGYLREDVGAVPVLDNHLLKTPNLSLDTAKAFQVSGFHFRIYADCFS
jgi:hypothetical protein